MPFVSRRERKQEALRKHLGGNAEEAGARETERGARGGENAAYERQVAKSENIDRSEADPGEKPKEAVATAGPRERYGAPEASEKPPERPRDEIDDLMDRVEARRTAEAPTKSTDSERAENRDGEDDDLDSQIRATVNTDPDRNADEAGSEAAEEFARLREKYPRAYALFDVARATTAPVRAQGEAAAAVAKAPVEAGRAVAGEIGKAAAEVAEVSGAAPELTSAADRLRAFTAFLKGLGVGTPEPAARS